MIAVTAGLGKWLNRKRKQLLAVPVLTSRRKHSSALAGVDFRHC